ncbi:MAG: 3-oxoacyl-ACP reductase FabG [Oscillospiraceae bacterium]|nr:3-oxoacyl-ACP reductase FabG [Oscillospiraceae bacterium]
MQPVVFITGASRGIGRATAKKFAQEGWQVAIHYHKAKEQAKALAEELREQGCNAQTFQADVADGAQIRAAIRQAEEQLGPISALVNNAGIAQQKLFTDVSEEEWDRMFDVTIKSCFHTCQAVLPSMIRRQKGSIVNLSSIWGISGASCEVHYSAAKAAVIGFTKALAQEVGPSHIRVNCVAPGVVRTEMNNNLSEEDLRVLKDETPLEMIGEPEDIAEAIYFLVSEQSRFITGQILSPNGGFVI